VKKLYVLLALGALILAACDSGGDDGPLVVYSGRAEELVQPLIDRFEQESGIEVDVRYAGSTDLAATLLQEGEATEADVFYAQDPASLGSVASLLAPIDDEILDRVEPRFSDKDGRWVGTSGRVRVFVYNTGTDLPLPETIDDVNDPAWAGQLGIAPTNGSFLAFVSAMILERGEEETLAWLEELAANQPVTFDGNAPIVDATDAGEIQGGLVNHYYLLRLRAEGGGTGAENLFIPAGDVGSLVMPAGAGIIEGTDQPDGAAQFVDFLLSEESQEYFATETFEFPVIEGVELGQGMPDLSEIVSPDIDLSALADVLEDATRLVSEAGLV
jgi:iron(III) transport system substrate-binding protein